MHNVVHALGAGPIRDRPAFYEQGAAHITNKGLRILCYHGGSFDDEHRFMPGVFMRQETFRARLAHLSRCGYPILPLGAAIQRLAAGDYPPCATVITIDDGFYSTYRDAAEALREFRAPATIYITTYHASKETPVFRLVVQYQFWKTQTTSLDCAGLSVGQSGVKSWQTAEEKRRLCWEIIDYAESQLTEHQRCELARELGKRLGVDYDEIAESRRFHLMTADEIRTLAGSGFDIQLHTHRHRFPVNQQAAIQEITDNRAFLSGLVPRPLEHFCYPSGVWSREHWPWLSELGVVSATTCDSGLNYPDTPPHALLRFLDSDDITAIEFAAELAGMSECLRRICRGTKRLLRWKS
jgi:peptidoglycan/xylan/chitin deacetylase (PgdA/CDA1 family)